MWRNPKPRSDEGYYCLCKRKEKKSHMETDEDTMKSVTLI